MTLREGLGSSSIKVPRYPSSSLFPFFYFGVSLLKLSCRKKGTLILNGLLGNLGSALGSRFVPVGSVA